MTLLLVILGLACAAALWVASTTLLFFLYESRNTSHMEQLAELGYSNTDIIRRILGFGFLSEIGIYLQILTTPLTTWCWSPARGKASYDDGETPVLLVHGLYGNASNWLCFRWALRRQGLRHVYAYSYSSFGPDYFALMEKLDRMVDATREKHGGRPVFLVGHSLGGLIIRGYMSSGAAVENGA
ncbi:MAG: esterase/lipase family protein, partial [Oceanidesulfovibrio sp.]